MKVSFILLAHEAPEHLQPVIETLLASGSDVYIHHDAKAPFDLRRDAAAWELERFPGQLFHADRVHVSWGEWSIVQATLNCMRLAREQEYNTDYFMLLSGSCMPVKPIHTLESFLQKNNGIDFIEVVNAHQHRWITDGIQHERWEQFHYINWREHPALFSVVLDMQKKLGIKRQLPLKHTPFMGSQWWCLRATTVDPILTLIDKHPKLERFYHRTWVPDELFFQTMVGNLIPADNIRTEILSRYKFNSWGVPRVYYDDDVAELLAETTYFARKISHRAPQLKKTLQNICALDRAAYRSFINDPRNEYLAALDERQRLKEDVKNATWFGLATSQENEFDYIKSIPNPMIAVVSGNRKTSARLLDAFRYIEDTAVFGNILGRESIDFGEGITTYAGYSADDVTRAQHNWHLFLGEIACHAQGKTIVFALDETPLPYLDVLRWKANLTVIVVDEPDEALQQGCDLSPLCVRGEVSLFLAKDAACRFVRLPADDLARITRTFHNLPMNIDELWNHLEEKRRTAWPSLQPGITDRYEFLKSIPNPMIIVCAPDQATSESVLNTLAQNGDVAIFSGDISFAKKDWYFAIGDIAHCSPHRTLAFALHPENIFYIETLRWKENCTVFIIEESLKVDDNFLDLSTLQKINDAKNTISTKLGQLLQDKFCQAVSLTSHDTNSSFKMQTGITHVKSIDEFCFHFDARNYIKSISNPMIVIVCGEEETEARILATFHQKNEVVVLNELFDAPLNNLQEASSAREKQNSEESRSFHYKTMLNLKQRAIQAGNKALIFTLDCGHAPFLKLLTAKNDVVVIVVDEPSVMRKNGCAIETLFFRSQACRQLSRDPSCHFTRLPLDTLLATTKNISSQPMDLSTFWKQLSTFPVLNWPSLHPAITDQYEFLKSIPNPMIFICAPDEETRRAALGSIQKNPYFSTFPGKIPYQENDWHHVIGDLSYYNPSHALALSLDEETVSYLKTLRWKENCAVLIINESVCSTAEELLKDGKDTFFREVNTILQDKACEAFYCDTKHSHSVFNVQNGFARVKNIEEFLAYFTLKYGLERIFKITGSIK